MIRSIVARVNVFSDSWHSRSTWLKKSLEIQVFTKQIEDIRDASDILAGKYDDKPENWFYMVQGTGWLLLATLTESAEAKTFWKKANSHEICH